MTSGSTPRPMALLPKGGGQAIGTLAHAEESALREWYRSSGRSEITAATKIIASAHAKNCWLGCNCLEASANPPILVPVQYNRMKGFYTLRRDVDAEEGAERPDHDNQCEFWFDLDRHETLHREQRLRQFRLELHKRPWGIPDKPEAQAKAIAREDGASRDPGQRGTRQGTIARELWRVMRLGHIEYLDLSLDSNLTEEARKCITGLNRVDHGEIGSLAAVSTTYPDDTRDPGSRWARELATTKRWEKGTKPTGYLCTFADEIHENLIITPGKGRIEVENGIRRPSQNGVPIKGPFLTMTAFQIKDGRPSAYMAYAQPVVSRDCFAPVDSDFERTIAEAAIVALRAIRRSHSHLEILFRKPAFSTETDVGLCRPDFTCTTKNSAKPGNPKTRFVIEAMGYGDDEAYLDSKRTTHEAMRIGIGPIEEIAYAEKDAISRDGRSALPSRIIEMILRHAP